MLILSAGDANKSMELCGFFKGGFFLDLQHYYSTLSWSFVTRLSYLKKGHLTLRGFAYNPCGWAMSVSLLFHFEYLMQVWNVGCLVDGRFANFPPQEVYVYNTNAKYIIIKMHRQRAVRCIVLGIVRFVDLLWYIITKLKMRFWEGKELRKR